MRTVVERLELFYCQRCGKPLARVSSAFGGVIEFRCPRCHQLTTFVGRLASHDDSENRSPSPVLAAEQLR